MSKQRILTFTAAILLCLMVGIFASAPGMVQAITEITPTPDGGEPVIVPTVEPVEPTPAPTQAEPTEEAPDETVPDEDTDEEALLDDATSAFQSGDFDAAVELTTQVIDQNPNNAEALAIRGLARSQLGSFELAIDDLTIAIELMPYRWDFYLYRGDAFAQLGEYPDANMDYTTSLEKNPRFQSAYISLAGIAELRGQSDDVELYQTMALALIAQARGNTTEAIGLFTDAIALDNTTRMAAYAYYNRALVFHSMGDMISAIEDYDEALALYPDMHDAYLGRGIAHRVENDIAAAASDFVQRMEVIESETVEENIAVGEELDVLMSHGTVYYLSFEAMGGSSVTITASAQEGSGVDALIALIGPDGDPIAGDDDFGGGAFNLDSEIADLRLPSDGTYTLLVSHANGGFDGPIRVSVSCDASEC